VSFKQVSPCPPDVVVGELSTELRPVGVVDSCGTGYHGCPTISRDTVTRAGAGKVVEAPETARNPHHRTLPSYGDQ